MPLNTEESRESLVENFPIVPLQEKDLDQVINLLGQHPNYFNEGDKEEASRDFKKSLGEYERALKYFVMHDLEGKVIGVSGYGQEEACTDVYYIGWFAVDKNLQNKGLGKTMMKQIEKDLVQEGKARLLMVRAVDYGEADPTEIFYKKCGFQKTGMIKDYWADGWDLSCFTKHLNPKT